MTYVSQWKRQNIFVRVYHDIHTNSVLKDLFSTTFNTIYQNLNHIISEYSFYLDHVILKKATQQNEAHIFSQPFIVCFILILLGSCDTEKSNAAKWGAHLLAAIYCMLHSHISLKTVYKQCIIIKTLPTQWNSLKVIWSKSTPVTALLASAQLFE